MIQKINQIRILTLLAPTTSKALSKFSLLMMSLGILNVQPVLASGAEDFIKNLSGCFSVTFRYFEDGKHDQTIDGLYEWAGSLPGQPVTSIQHIGVMEGKAFKHWREEWQEDSGGMWKQKVIGPFEDFRYECSAPMQFNQWRCAVANAPKPRRDKDRSDYRNLDRENTIQSTSKGVVQMENNIKRDKDGKAVSNEVGWNEYRRVEESHCQAAQELIGHMK